MSSPGNEGVTVSESSGSPTVRAVPWAVVAGLLAAVLAWACLEVTLRAYRPSLMPPMKPFPSPEDTRMLLRAEVVSGSVAAAALGGWFGLLFGLFGGLSRQSIPSALPAGLLGLAVGAVLVAGAAYLIYPVVYGKLDPQSDDLTLPLVCRAAVWSLVGGVAGLAFGLGAGRPVGWPKIALGGLIGAAGAAIVYEVVGALVFPTHRTHLPVAGSPEARALAQFLIGVGTAAGLVLAARGPTARAQNKPAASSDARQ